MTGRSISIDLLRGAAIVLLLGWHASSIPVLYGLEIPYWLYLANEVFLPWRMPLLMLLSGLLLERSLRKNRRTFFEGKVRHLLWPYAIWAAVHLLTFTFADPVRDPRSWVATGYLWFIFFLLVFSVAAPLVVRVPRPVLYAALLGAAVFLPAGLAQRAAYFAVFFYVGHDVSRALPWLERRSMRQLAVGVGVGVTFTVASLFATIRTDTHFMEHRGLAAPIVLVMIATAIGVAHRIGSRAGTGAPVRAVTWLGRNSVVFYLVHFPVMALAVTALTAVGVTDGLETAAICFVLALGVCVGLTAVRRAQVVRWLFVGPRLLPQPGR